MRAASTNTQPDRVINPVCQSEVAACAGMTIANARGRLPQIGLSEDRFGGPGFAAPGDKPPIVPAGGRIELAESCGATPRVPPAGSSRCGQAR